MTAIIEINHLTYRPPSLPADAPDILHDISLNIEDGEFVAIIGENGSGKTSLIKQINGLLLPTNGQVRVKGLDTRDATHRFQLHALVGMVFQDPADQIVASTVEEDIAFGLENANLPNEEIRSRVRLQLEAAGLTKEAQRPPHLLSGGQIQKLALAGVLARQPEVILLDEPTSMLDPRSRSEFLQHINTLNQQGITIIYVTHHMEETVFADHIIILQDGQVALQGSPSDIYCQDINLYEVGVEKPAAVELADEFRRWGWDIPANTLTPEQLLQALPTYKGIHPGFAYEKPKQNAPNHIQFREVHYTYLAGTPLEKEALRGANVNITKCQIHAFVGTNGSGKSTLLQHINGILRPSQGHVRVSDLILEDPSTPLKEVIKKVGLVFQNPETQFFEVFVGDEIAYGPKQFEMDDVRDRVSQAMALVGLDFEAFKDRRLETLSGGEKRKVALASTLVLEQDILLFDEPTAGMDPNARNALLDLIQHLKEQGKTVVIASHRMEELARVSQHLSIMSGGKVVISDTSSTVLTDLKVINGTGLQAPLAVKVGLKLIEQGWPVQPGDTITKEKLIQSIRGVLS